MGEEDLVYYEGYGSRPRSLRKHWINCCLQVDDEVIEIDQIEDKLTPNEREVALPIRQLITRFENCHWNSERWLERILQAISEERVPPASGRPKAEHPLVQMLYCLREVLIHWLTQSTLPVPQDAILHHSAAGLVAKLGEWTPYKDWVIGRVVAGLEYHLYSEGLLSLSEASRMHNRLDVLTLDKPEAVEGMEDPDFFAQVCSQKLKIRRDINDEVEEHSLSRLIACLYPCNEFYLLFVLALCEFLDAPGEARILPAPLCGNIRRDRQFRYYRTINMLRQYLGQPMVNSLTMDKLALARLGEPTEVKRWLVSSLGKTLREQTPPPQTRFSALVES